MVKLHRTTVVFQPISENYDPHGATTKQARYLIRLAVACNEAFVPYEIEWGPKQNHVFSGFGATLTIRDVPYIPEAKPFPKEIKRRAVDWKPKPFQAEYRLEAYVSTEKDEVKWCPGFVIDHSSGLSLVRPSANGEWNNEVEDDDRKVTDDWRVTHRESGRGFNPVNFKRAVDILLLVAGELDWTLPMDELAKNPAGLKRCIDLVEANFGSERWSRNRAKERLEHAEQAA